MAMPAQPVSSIIRAASATPRTSPLPNTGMRCTASTTRRMPSWLTRPPNPCSRVRPWIVTAATPTVSNCRAKYGAVSWSSSQPSRIFTVTGTGTASTTLRTSSTVAPVVSHRSDDPPPVLTTLRTGHPMLMSTLSASWRSTSHLAAPAISSAFDPKICTAIGRSAGSVASRSIVRLTSSRMARALTRSVVQRPTPPTSRMDSRNGRFVYPASGARLNRDGSVSVPTRTGSR